MRQMLGDTYNSGQVRSAYPNLSGIEKSHRQSECIFTKKANFTKHDYKKAFIPKLAKITNQACIAQKQRVSIDDVTKKASFA